MYFELIKQLIDADFPNKKRLSEDRLPSTDELIDACECKKKSKSYFLTLGEESKNKNWKYWAMTIEPLYGDKLIQTFGKTPQTALSKLWLALQENNIEKETKKALKKYGQTFKDLRNK